MNKTKKIDLVFLLAIILIILGVYWWGIEKIEESEPPLIEINREIKTTPNYYPEYDNAKG